MKMISPVVTVKEKNGYMSPILHRIPNVCAALALFSLQRLPELNRRRRALTAFFLRHGKENDWPLVSAIREHLPLQKFPLFVRDAQEKRRVLKRKNMHLDDGWTGCVVCPDSIDLPATGYEWGDDPQAEKCCKQILSLPTHPTMSLRQAEVLAAEIDGLLEAERIR
jgi:dTDP-4-amino-4,6-dideoxygalactose transaminase